MKDDNEKIWAELKELYTLCKPLTKYMREHHTMHDRLVITESGATIFKDIGFVPASMGTETKELQAVIEGKKEEVKE